MLACETLVSLSSRTKVRHASLSGRTKVRHAVGLVELKSDMLDWLEGMHVLYSQTYSYLSVNYIRGLEHRFSLFGPENSKLQVTNSR